MTKQSVTHTFNTYIADDGSSFNSKLECISYEHTKSLVDAKQQLWAVIPRKHIGRPEIFSSEALAKLSLKYALDHNKFNIYPIEIDARFIYDSTNMYPEYKDLK